MKAIRFLGFACIVSQAVLLAACSDAGVDPVTPAAPPVSSANHQNGRTSGPEKPKVNLEVILRGEDGAFGHVKFRQPKDDAFIIELDTWVRGLLPNERYLLQRAVDTNVDGNCTSTAWLTLGKGLQPQAIVTDDKGTGKEALFRNVAAIPVGTSFDIHFRVIRVSDAETPEVVLLSECYQFTISQ